jgi:hypothetical protein
VEFVSGGHLGAGYGFRSVDPSTPGLSTGKRPGVAKVEVTEPGVDQDKRRRRLLCRDEQWGSCCCLPGSLGKFSEGAWALV